MKHKRKVKVCCVTLFSGLTIFVTIYFFLLKWESSGQTGDPYLNLAKSISQGEQIKFSEIVIKYELNSKEIGDLHEKKLFLCSSEKLENYDLKFLVSDEGFIDTVGFVNKNLSKEKMEWGESIR